MSEVTLHSLDSGIPTCPYQARAPTHAARDRDYMGASLI